MQTPPPPTIPSPQSTLANIIHQQESQNSYVDSGASHHMTANSVNIMYYWTIVKVCLLNLLPIKSTGSILFSSYNSSYVFILITFTCSSYYQIFSVSRFANDSEVFLNFILLSSSQISG